MNIKLELLQNAIFDAISDKLSYMEIDVDKIADTTAISALSEIKNILCDDTKSDFDAIEKIVRIFEKYHIETDGRHDF